MAGDLFVRAHAGESLDAFAGRMAAVFNLGRVERRESSSYAGEEYFKAASLSVTVKFARADEADLEGYDFWLHLQPTEVWIENPFFVDGLADLLARALTLAGEHVVRIVNAERRDSRRKVFYEIDLKVPRGSKGHVVTTEK